MINSPSLAVSWSLGQKVDLPTFLTAAASAGFDGVHLQPYQVLNNELGGPKGLAAYCSDLGIRVDALDPMVSPLPGAPDPQAVGSWMRRLVGVSAERCFEAAAEVGARTINTVQFGCERSSIAEVAAVFGELCGRAADVGVELAFEFMPDVTDVGSPADAVELLECAGRPANGKIMLDVWHLYRGGRGAADVRAVPPGLIGAVQINDASLADHDDPREPQPDRLMPGEGAIPIVAVLAPILSHHQCRSVAVEVFSRRWMARPIDESLGEAARIGRKMLCEAADRAEPTRADGDIPSGH